MTKAQLEDIKVKIANILNAYMSKDDAVERANNITQIFVWGDTYCTVDIISGFITPNVKKSGISNIDLRKEVATQICMLKV